MSSIENLFPEELFQKIESTAKRIVTLANGGIEEVRKIPRSEDLLCALKTEFLKRLEPKEVYVYPDERVQSDSCFIHKPTWPEDIDLSDELSNTFGKREVEDSAVNLVKFFQWRHNSKWCSFTFELLANFYREQLGIASDNMLFGLYGLWFDDAPIVGGNKIAPHYIVLCSDGEYRITNLFIEAIEKHVHKSTEAA